MALDKFEQANLKRLEACVRPNEKRINTLKERLKKQTEETVLKIRELEKANEGFNELIAELKAKEAEIEGEVGEESTIISEEVTEDTVPEPDFPEIYEYDEKGTRDVYPNNPSAANSFATQEDFPY